MMVLIMVEFRFLFYPTLVYAILDKSYVDHPENLEAGEAGAGDERTPLLRE